MHRPTDAQRDEAATLALNAVEFLFSDEERLQGFLGTTGIDAEDLKAGLSTTEVQSGVLEYLLGGEDLLLAFCEAYDIEPEHPLTAATILTGVIPEW